MVLIDFLVDDWKSSKYDTLVGNRTIYLAYGTECYHFDNRRWSGIEELSSDQEEVDTRMLLHSKHASNGNYEKIIIHTPDTDVFILMVYFSTEIAGLCMKTGRGNKQRIIIIIIIHKYLYRI